MLLWTHSSCLLRWNKYLAKFVNSLCKHLNKRLAKEASSHTHMANGRANGHSPQGRQQLSTDAQRSLARVILRMADKAQYSKAGLAWCLCLPVCVGDRSIKRSRAARCDSGT